MSLFFIALVICLCLCLCLSVCLSVCLSLSLSLSLVLCVCMHAIMGVLMHAHAFHCVRVRAQARSLVVSSVVWLTIKRVAPGNW